MKARDVMTHCVVGIAPEAPILDAISRMISHQVSGMPVIDAKGKLVGIVTEGDLVRRVETGTEPPRRRWLELLLGPGSRADEYSRVHGRSVQDVMSRDVVTVGKDTPLTNVVRLMEENQIKRIPVVEDDAVVGIVSRADLVFALSKYLIQAPKGPTTDESIRRKIVSEMKRQSWCPVNSVRVAVRQGRVRFDGAIFDERERGALRVLAENIDGVKAIEDRLTCVEPMTGAIIGGPVPVAGKNAPLSA